MTVGYPDWINNATYLSITYEHFNVTDDYVENLFNAYGSKIIKMGKVSFEITTSKSLMMIR